MVQSIESLGNRIKKDRKGKKQVILYILSTSVIDSDP